MTAATIMEAFLTLPNALVMAASSAVIMAISKAFPAANAGIWQRLKAGASIALCVVACLLPGVQPADMPIGERVLLGIALGSVAGQAYKIFQQTFMGKDSRV